jgi:transcriptional regulator with XRE-family HTH domain
MGNAEVFGGRIRAWRAARRYSQPELARRSGLSVRTIKAYEAGSSRPSLRAACALAAALDVPLEELAGEESAQR